MYKRLWLFLMFITTLVMIAVTISQKPVVETRTVYRYLPRSFDDETSNTSYPSDIFRKMFNQPSPWINSITELDHAKLGKLQKYYISQA